MGDWSWQDDAACRWEPLALFFGTRAERPRERDERERKAGAICRQCPVRSECLTYAITRPEKYGFWGGLDEDERASERRRRLRRDSYQAGSVEPPKVREKLCRRCKTVKAAEEFPRDKRSGDGLNSRCTGCTNEAERERRAARRVVA